MAAYGRKQDRYRFYELNPAVTRVAIDDFTYLRESPADITVVSGDARLSLERESPQAFDLLVVDAFSGDSIPVHLLTREAFALYFRHLQPAGAVAVHVTNKHLELSPVVKMLADASRASASLIHNSSAHENGINMSSWVLVTRNKDLQREVSWLTSPVSPKSGLAMWTDDYSNLLSILR
jgi:spermidine synthase